MADEQKEEQVGPQKFTINCCNGCKHFVSLLPRCLLGVDGNGESLASYQLPLLFMTLTPHWCPVMEERAKELEEYAKKGYWRIEEFKP